jgi:hypothetical protein
MALGVPALAQNADTLVQRYTDLARSKENAQALVTGLRDGTPLTLNSGNTTTVIDAPTGKMGYGNVDNALALAEASLQKQGITNPNAEQLKTSLLSVLQMRADGRGWGEIANSLGLRLGDVKRADKAERVAGAERAQRPERPDRPEKPERAVRPGR